MNAVDSRTMSELYKKIDILESENENYKFLIEDAIEKIDAYGIMVHSMSDYQGCHENIFGTIALTLHNCLNDLSNKLRKGER